MQNLFSNNMLFDYKVNKVCFIGHRKVLKIIRERLKNAVEDEIKNGCKFFTMGTYGDFDVMALEVCRELRQIYKDIKIEVVITSFKKIEKQLLYADKFGEEYEIPYSDVSTIMYDIEEYFKRKIVASNQKMIENCTTLICYVNKKHNPSGAKLAMNYAKRKGLKIINLYNEKDNPTFNMTMEEKEIYYKNIRLELKK